LAATVVVVVVVATLVVVVGSVDEVGQAKIVLKSTHHLRWW
jgi:hypothetical protein